MAWATFQELAVGLAERAELPSGWDLGPSCVEWSDGGLLRRLRVDRLKHDPKWIVWWVEVLDEPTRDPTDDTALRIVIDYSKKLGVVKERLDAGYPRVTTVAKLNETMVDDVRLLAPPSLAFAKDRIDLARILMSNTPVARGHLIDQRWPKQDGNLLAALAIARDAGDAELESEVMAAVRAQADTVVPAPRDSFTHGWTYAQHFAFSASFMDTWIPVDLSDLYDKPKRRRR